MYGRQKKFVEFLMGKFEEMGPQGRQRCGSENNINTYFIDMNGRT
jgi:hypothetical protein